MFQDASDSGHTKKEESDAPLSVDDVPSILRSNSPLPSLQIRTDLPIVRPSSSRDSDPYASSSFSGSYPRRTPSLRALIAPPLSSAGSLSPASIMSSPQLNAMGDITPLPSPIGGAVPWRRGDLPSLSRSSSITSRNGSSLRLSDSSQTLGPPAVSRSRAKPYTGIDGQGEESPVTNRYRRDSHSKHSHSRNRSLSDYAPPGRVTVPPRPIAVSGNAGLGIAPSSSTDSKSNGLHREQYLAVHRGIALPIIRPPSPPRSSGSEYNDNEPVIHHPTPLTTPQEIYSVRSVRTDQARIYQKIRTLGQGTFSQVSLAARVESIPGMPLSPGGDEATQFHGFVNTQKLVAVKIIEHGPAGGADEGRLEVSLKREVEILKSVNHPSLVQLKAFGSDEKRALLVLDYCPGGDLFEFATSGAPPMSPGLIRRIFAELIDAVRYLHTHYIVHRDIKLESESLSFARSWRLRTDGAFRCSADYARPCYG